MAAPKNGRLGSLSCNRHSVNAQLVPSLCISLLVVAGLHPLELNGFALDVLYERESHIEVIEAAASTQNADREASVGTVKVVSVHVVSGNGNE